MRATGRFFIAAGLLACATGAGALDDREIFTRSIDCGTLHGFFAGALEDTDPADAAVNEELAMRHFAMAYARDVTGGEVADVAVDKALEALKAKTDALVADEAKLEAFLTAEALRCEALRVEVRAEFDAVDLSS